MTEQPRQPYHIPSNERYFLDADGYCWREVEIDGEITYGMARVNPDNSPIPAPVNYLTPVTSAHHTLRAYRLALFDAAAIFRQTANQYDSHTIGRHTHDEAARVLRKWAQDPGRMLGPLHRLRDPSQASTQVDALFADRHSGTSAPTPPIPAEGPNALR